jgi:hypothetical protein
MSYGPSSAGSSARTRLVYTAAIVYSFGGLLFGYDTGIIPGALLYVREDFALDPFWLFAAIGIVAWFFVYFMVPGTKGRSLEEIEADMRGTSVASSSVG